MRPIGKTLWLSVIAALCGAAPALGDPWPQWRGPRGDGISHETGLMARWPAGGPAELWRVGLGGGFSSVSAVGDRAYTMFGSPQGEFVACLDVHSGKILWKTRCGDLFTNSYGDGPRATPTRSEE